jgi:hypothetical protein
MNRPKTCRSIALGVLALLAAAGAASAQSDADLRRENQGLRTRVNDLQRELDAARNRIRQLEREVEQLRQLLAAAPQTQEGPTTGEKVTIDESVPHASPRALLKALQDGYLEAMLDLDIGDPVNPEGRRHREAYLRQVHRWTRQMNRKMKAPIEWHIRFAQRAAYPLDAPGFMVEAVDPQTHAVLGDPFPMALPEPIVRRLRQREERGELTVLVVKGVLIPRIGVNPERHEQGLFDKPRFIGPFAEFEFVVEASSVTPPPKPKEQPERPAPGRS